MVEVVKLGSLYFDGQPQEIGVPYNGKRLLFAFFLFYRTLAKITTGMKKSLPWCGNILLFYTRKDGKPSFLAWRCLFLF